MTEKDAVNLASLLHDIGKFWQRAGSSAPEKYNNYTEEEYGKNGAHAKWSAGFIDQCVPTKFNQNVAELVFYHHKPKSYQQEIIQKADHLSAGADRKDRGDESLGHYLKVPLASILEKVSLENDFSKSSYYHKILPLSLSQDTIFPTSRGDLPDTLTEIYKKQWNLFAGELKKLPDSSFEQYFFSLYYLLKKYTWCIPSAVYKSEPDIPLFDHLKTTAAITNCLYETKGKEEFILVEGDFSGIQSFIYNIASSQKALKGTGKRLRGRSFYLTLLAETIADYLVKELGLYVVNKLWCSGGHFLLLAPDNENVRKIIKEKEEEITRWLYNEYIGSLGFVLEFLPIKEDGLKKFDESLSKLGILLEEKKKKKFSSVLLEDEVLDFRRGMAVCRVCDADLPKPNQEQCEKCSLHERIGEQLPKAEFIYRSNSPENPLISFGKFSAYWRFEELTGIGVDRFAVNTTEDFLVSNSSCGFMFLPQCLPDKDFSKIAEDSEGANFLAVLRMDVDNLGAVFSIGLGEDKSISRLSCLSGALDLFFSGYLSQFCQEKNKELRENNYNAGNIYVTYAGGDDLFVVGSWNEIVELAELIKEEFSKYCCGNKDIHLSGGIYLCKGKYPIKRGAKSAGDTLDTAKKDGKNGLNIFNKTVPWSEYPQLKELCHFLLEKINTDKLSRSFIYYLLRLYQNSESKDKPDAISSARFLYSVKRNVKDEKLRLELRNKVWSNFKWTPVWAGYVSLILRDRKEKE